MNGGLIVLEGPDGAGKTTLARKIQELNPGKTSYLHNVKRKNIWRWHYVTALMVDRLLRKGRLVIVDRWWPSEAVYGTVYRQGSEYPWTSRYLDRIVRTYGGIYVLALPPLELCLETHRRERPHREHELAGVAKIWEGYRNWSDYRVAPEWLTSYFDLAPKPDFVYDRSKTIDQPIHEMAMMFIELAKTNNRDWREQAVLRNNPHWAGALRPDRPTTFWVGDRLNPRKRQARWAFVDNEHSGRYLAHALSLAGIPETDAFWMNAHDPGSHELIDWLDHQVLSRYTRIVSFGGDAHRTIEIRLGFGRSIKVPHPSWAMRYGQIPVYDYAEILKEAYTR